MIALSTCWNSHRHTDGGDMVAEIAAMGFDTVEISHGLKLNLLPGIQDAFHSGKIKICGLHNFCPSPVEILADAPDCYEFTSDKKNDRDRALKLTLKTLDLAAEFSARYVVVHLGSVPMRSVTAQLEEMATSGKLFSKEYSRLKLEAVRERERLGPTYLDRAREALEKICERAGELGVTVAVESRSHYEQVPTERELEGLIDEFQDTGAIGYWHDFGHVQRKANLGFLNHHQWLARMQPNLVGCHLHDVVWPARDHMIPFEGSLDFDELMPLVPAGTPVVWELSLRRKKANIIAALPRWRELFDNRASASSDTATRLSAQ